MCTVGIFNVAKMSGRTRGHAFNSHQFQFARTHKLQFIAKSLRLNPCPNYAFDSRLAVSAYSSVPIPVPVPVVRAFARINLGDI